MLVHVRTAHDRLPAERDEVERIATDGAKRAGAIFKTRAN
jgi:hypothetical protein